jgi:two-component system, LuxR family, sensor histidine kinase DctS
MMTVLQNWFSSKGAMGSILGTHRETAPLPWALLAIVTTLFVLAISALTAIVYRYEQSETQRLYEKELTQLSASFKAQLLSDVRSLQISGSDDTLLKDLYPLAQRLGRERQAVHSVDLREPSGRTRSLYRRSGSALMSQLPIAIGAESRAALEIATRKGEATFANSYFLPLTEGGGTEVMELWVPMVGVRTESSATDPALATSVRVLFQLSAMLKDYLPAEFSTRNELTLREVDGTVIAWGPTVSRGAGIFKTKAILDLPGNPIMIHANNESTGPKLIPNLLLASVVGLTCLLLYTLWRLMLDIRRRALAELRLREAFLFRKAMEDSLITGLRARDLTGRVTYVNPAFCAMVGFNTDELVGMAPPMPYWAPEGLQEYEQRLAQVLAGTITPEGFETTFMRRNGERFPVIVYEAPLVGDDGRQTGWMSSILDLSERRQIEDLNKRQQEKLERAGRLATMGELASVLSHELNQPLSAIASYATGAGNLLDKHQLHGDLREVVQRIQVQAQRAGNIVHRVHDFVRRRELKYESVDLIQVIAATEPLMLLQSQTSGVRMIFESQPTSLPVNLDRVLLEQVLLNLTRNAIEAVSLISAKPSGQPAVWVKCFRGQGVHAGFALVQVIDNGPGVAPEVADQLFSSYVTTKAEGMGIGLNICRSVVERFGGTLWYETAAAGGAIFAFTLPLEVIE